MAPIAIKFVVSFSSQDDNYKVQSLISAKECKKWLSNPKERSGQMEAIFQLEDFCQIAYIAIGTIWCSDIEIQVGRSDWPQDMSYVTLSPTACLMTVVDIKKGENVSKVRMFKKDDFVDNVVSKKWDRIKLLLRQRFRKDVQFGLSLVKVDSVSSDKRKKITSTLSLEGDQQVEHIKDHFFGSKMKSDSPDNTLRERLLKISSSGEGGGGQSLTRTAKLVLAAADNNNNSNSNAAPAAKRGLFSDHVQRKSSPTFEEEIVKFLFDQKLSPLDLDSITVADLRHKYEKLIKRKLSKDEKKVFMQYCQSYLVEMIEGDINPMDNTKKGVASTISSPKDEMDILLMENKNLHNSTKNLKTVVPDNNHNYISISADSDFSDDDLLVPKSEKTQKTSPAVKCIKEQMKDSSTEIKNNSGLSVSKINKFSVFKPSDPNSPINKLLKSKRTSKVDVDITPGTSHDISSSSSPSSLSSSASSSCTDFTSSCNLSEPVPSKRKRNTVDEFDIYEFNDDSDSSSTKKKAKWRGKTRGRCQIRGNVSTSDGDRSTSNNTDIWLTAGVGHKLGSSSSSSSSNPRSAQPIPVLTEEYSNINMATCSMCNGKVKDYLMDHHILQCSMKSRLSDIEVPPLPKTFDDFKLNKPSSKPSVTKKSTFVTLENRIEQPSTSYHTLLNVNSDSPELIKSVNNSSVVIEDDDEIMVACPVCTEMFSANIITVHTNHCLDSIS